MQKSSAPFGVKVQRFLNLGYHPKFDVTSGTAKFSKIFPGCYYNDKSPKIVSKVPSWKRHVEIEEFSQKLGYHGEHILKRRKWLNSINGPAWQDVPYTSQGRAITFPKASRHSNEKFKSFDVPGPGTYGKNHVPHTRQEEKSNSKGFSFSTLPPFEHCAINCRGTSLSKPYHLPPNIYNIKSSIDELVLKKTSKRGPYDLFSGERFPDKNISKAGPRPRVRSYVDYTQHQDEWKGKFLRCGKEEPVTTRIILKTAQKNFLDPGPGYYSPYRPPPVVRAKFPFNKSEMEVRPSAKRGICPPLGRYNAVAMRKIKGDGFKSNFVSKIERGSPQIPKWSWFE